MPTGPLVTLACFTWPHEALLFKGLLESRGLAAFMADEHLITMQWMWETALGGVKVQVPPQELDDAREVLIDYRTHRLSMPSFEPVASTPRSATHFYGWRAMAIICWAATGVVFPVPEKQDEH